MSGQLNDIPRAALECAAAASASPWSQQPPVSWVAVVRVAPCCSCSTFLEELLMAARKLVMPIDTRSQWQF